MTRRPGVRIGGHDLRALDPDAVRGMIAVVSQDTWLFHGTVEDNLRLGRPDATEADLVAAAAPPTRTTSSWGCRTATQTAIGERGSQLSGGQRQRIAIARALLRDAPILVLDEALSSVDAENEAVIQQALDRLMTGRTTLILAHRLSSVIGADRILVLEDGAVVQTGTHAALIAQDGPYRRLMGPQMAEHAGQRSSSPNPRRRVRRKPKRRPARRSRSRGRRRLGRLAGDDPDADAFRPPYRRQLGSCGVRHRRVAAFIGVGVLGALLLGAVRNHRRPWGLVDRAAAAAPLAGCCTGWNPGSRTPWPMRCWPRCGSIVPQARRAGAGYLLRRRSGDLVALATQDVETVEYFFAHTIAPAIVAVLVPAAVLIALLVIAWPLAIALAPFLIYAAARRCAGASGSIAWARRRAARWAAWAHTFPKRSRAWANWWRSTPPAAATASWTRCGSIRRRGCACSPI
jgi:ATP-binding cassette subfamily B protein